MSAPSYTPQLRPLSIGEMLDAGFRLFRHRFGTLLACVLVPLVPLTVLFTILIASAVPDAYDPNAPAATGDETTGILVVLLVVFLLFGVGATMAIAACFKVISSAYLGERATAASSLRFGLKRTLPLIAAYLVISIATAPLNIFAALIIPGLVSIWLNVKWAMAFPVIVAERAGPFRAMGRSWALTRNNWWRTFATILVLFILAFVIYLALVFGLGIALDATANSAGTFAVAILNTLLNIIALAIIFPLVSAIMTVIYFDLRVRNEGFDLELLAKGVGGGASHFERAPELPGPPSPGPAPRTGGFAAPEGPAAAP